MKQITAIRILPFALLQALLASFIGLMEGIVYSFGGLAIDTLVSLAGSPVQRHRA